MHDPATHINGPSPEALSHRVEELERKHGVRLTLIVCGALIGLCITFYIGWSIGRWYGVHHEFERQFEEDRQLASPVLAIDPVFQRIMPVNFPVRGFCLSGPVPTQADHDRLRVEMVRLFGEPRIEHVLADVWVE
jgi:hypothetical protein